MNTLPYYEMRRAELVTHLQGRGITSRRVLDAIGSVAREYFVPDVLLPRAYEDNALPIDCRQTISQPYTVAFMTQLLGVQPGDKVLEIGTGSGYQAAVLAALGARVFTVERHRALYLTARKRFENMGLSIATHLGDGTLGWSAYAPYQGIIVTAGSPDVPRTLTRQLAVGGRLVIPVGSQESQVLYRITRLDDRDSFHGEEFHDFRFVPLIGKEGWPT